MRVLARQVVSELFKHARMDVVGAEFVRMDPPYIVGFVVDCWRSRYRPSNVRSLVLLARFAIGVGDDVVRVRVNAEEASDLGLHAGFLFSFTNSAFSSALTKLLLAARDCPLARIASLDEQDLAGLVDDQEVGRRHEGVGCWSRRVVVVLSPAHVDSLPRLESMAWRRSTQYRNLPRRARTIRRDLSAADATAGWR